MTIAQTVHPVRIKAPFYQDGQQIALHRYLDPDFINRFRQDANSPNSPTGCRKSDIAVSIRRRYCGYPPTAPFTWYVVKSCVNSLATLPWIRRG
jgi:hypothetical protein